MSEAPAAPAVTYLIQFAHVHLDFRQTEFHAALFLHNVDPADVYTPGSFNVARPFMICSFPTPELAKLVTERCVLIKQVYTLLSTGTDTQTCLANTTPTTSDSSWKFTFETFAFKFTRDEQSAIMQSFIQTLAPPGAVSMKTADDVYTVIHEYEVTGDGSPLYPRFDHTGNPVAENQDRPPLNVFLTKHFCAGNRDLCDKYALTKRTFLGPTSMDNELSLIMCTSALVTPGSLVFDPFVGTGSILFSAAVFGAVTFGTDIDIRILRGKATNLFSNFDQAGLSRPEVSRADNSMHSSIFKTEELYDAIVTDPPYGIRAGARRSGVAKDKEVKVIPADRRHDHIPRTQVYEVCDVMMDLLGVAARSLRMGGRLVYIIPSIVDFDEDTDLPRHPCLKLQEVCFQPLQISLGRRMVVMVKTVKYNANELPAYRSFCWKNGPESADKVANLRDKLLEISLEKKRLLKEEGVENKKGKDGGQMSRKKMKKLMRNKITPKDRSLSDTK